MGRPTIEKTYLDDYGVSLMLISGRLVLGMMGGDAGAVVDADQLRKMAQAFTKAADDAERKS